MQVDHHRSQHQNRLAARARLGQLITEALKRSKRRRRTNRAVARKNVGSKEAPARTDEAGAQAPDGLGLAPDQPQPVVEPQLGQM